MTVAVGQEADRIAELLRRERAQWQERLAEKDEQLTEAWRKAGRQRGRLEMAEAEIARLRETVQELERRLDEEPEDVVAVREDLLEAVRVRVVYDRREERPHGDSRVVRERVVKLEIEEEIVRIEVQDDVEHLPISVAAEWSQDDGGKTYEAEIAFELYRSWRERHGYRDVVLAEYWAALVGEG